MYFVKIMSCLQLPLMAINGIYENGNVLSLISIYNHNNNVRNTIDILLYH